MKFSTIIQSAIALFAIATPSSVIAGDGECEATYSVNFDANYPNNVTVKCTEADMNLITKIIHSVVELDALASDLATAVPTFNFITEEYGEGAIVDDTGKLATPPDAAEIIEHLTPEDLMEELYYETGVDDDKTRRLKEHEDFEAAVVFAEPMVLEDQQAHRRMELDCGQIQRCWQLWCCQICGWCWKRRQLSLNGRDSQALSLRTRAGGIKEDEEAEDAVGEHDQAYLREVEMHEQRVSAELLKKFRYMMRKESIGCLGNFWELEVIFKMII